MSIKLAIWLFSVRIWEERSAPINVVIRRQFYFKTSDVSIKVFPIFRALLPLIVIHFPSHAYTQTGKVARKFILNLFWLRFSPLRSTAKAYLAQLNAHANILKFHKQNKITDCSETPNKSLQNVSITHTHTTAPEDDGRHHFKCSRRYWQSFNVLLRG